MSKVRTNDGYKDIEAVYAGSIPIDAIYDKNGNILFSAYNEVNGIPTLSFKSKTNNSSTLKNYRIYGNTVSGESVGDLVESGEHSGEYVVPVKIEGKNLYDINSTETINAYVGNTLSYGPNYVSVVFPCEPNTTYTITKISSQRFAVGYITGEPEKDKEVRGRLSDNNGTRITITTDNSADYLIIWVYNAQYDTLTSNEILSTLKIAVGSYYAPVTTNIYLPDQIKKVGSEYEYIDYAEQKQYFADGTSVSVALPAISTFVGINSFDVETNVIPSSVSIYGKIKSEMTTYMESITPDASIGKVIFVTKSYIPKSGQNLYAGILARTVAEGTEFDGILDSSHYDYLRGTSDPEMKRYRCTWRKTYVQGEKYYARAYCKYLDKNNEQIECYGHIYSADMNGFEMSDVYTITYKSQDGQTTLYTETVIQGKNGTYNTTPTKSSTAQYDYTFAGWSTSTDSTTATHGATQNIQSDIVLYAAFAETVRSYNVTFYNGQTPLGTSSVNYGSNATYSGATPTKASTQQYEYNFLGWNTNPSATTADADALANITSDRTVYAIFEQTTMIYTVYFYNESTLLETVQNVPYGGTATYTGSTPTKTNYTFTGWSPEPTNITADTSCYAQFEAAIQGLITDSWETIAQRAVAGTAQNYYSVGDCKAITLNGTCGTLELNNETLYVYILGFNHNAILEGTGITFGGFKTNYDSSGKDVALIDSHCDSNDTTGLKWFNMNHRQGSSQYGHNYGGWKGSDMRYDILGSTDTAPSGYGTTATTSNVGYDASPTCAINPVANTLMSCLPSDLRAVMKPITKYTDNVGNSSNISGNVTTSIDYLPLLAEYEIFEERTYANQYEQNNQAQYAYYADSNNSKVKYRHSSTGSAAYWWGRSPHYGSGYIFCGVHIFGGASSSSAMDSCGVAPIFLVSLQTYTVSYYSQDGLTLLGTETVNNGQNAQGLTQNPTKASDTDCDYTFVGWNSQGNKTTAEANILNSITQNKAVYAAFEQVYKSDTISDSWEDIVESCSDGTYSSKYSVGDLKTIDLGTEGVVQMQIVGIDTDDKADDSGKAPITWISKQLLNTSHRMNPYYSSDTEGTGSLGGWEKTEMRSYLKETIKPLIPETVRNAIKSVKKYTKIHDVSGSAVNDVLTTEDVWIPSYQEISGSSGSESSGVYYSSAFPDNASRIKSKTGASAAWWWLRTACTRNGFTFVGTDGSGGGYNVATGTNGVALGFCT